MNKLLIKDSYLYNIPKKAIFWSIISTVVSLPYILILYFHKFFGIRDMWSFHISFHLLNYGDFGFVKRGIVGSFIKPIFLVLRSLNISLESIILVNYICLLLVFCAFYWYLSFDAKTPKFARLALLFTPATFQFLGFDSPRTSELIWLILFSIWCVIFSRIKILKYIHCALSGILLSLCALTYEGSLIILFPTIFFQIIFKNNLKSSIRFLLNIIFFISPIIISTYLLFQFGNFEGDSSSIRNLLDNFKPGIWDTLSEVIVNDHISENAKMIENSKVNWFSNNIIFLIYFIWYLIINLIEILKDKSLKNMIILSSSFSAIFLCIVAVDYSRYIALSMITNSMCLFICKKDKQWANDKYWLPILFSGLLGPIGCAGMINPFPLWKFIFDFIN